MGQTNIKLEKTKCERCGACCNNSPGWFAPGEVEDAAKFLKIPVDEFVKKYVIIDGIDHPEKGWLRVFAPVRLNRFGEPAMEPLSEVDDIYRFIKGPCIFLSDQGCSIYPVRPLECKSYFCCNREEDNIHHQQIACMY